MKVYIVMLHHFEDGFLQHSLRGVYQHKHKALDGRLTNRMFNTPWRQDEVPGRWTTRPTDYAHRLYAYYTCVEEELR